MNISIDTVVFDYTPPIFGLHTRRGWHTLKNKYP